MTTGTTSPSPVTVHGRDRPLVVGLGGTLRCESSTERALRHRLVSVERQGGRAEAYCGADIDLPMYNPHEPARTPKARKPPIYLDNKPWGCVTCAYGWQAAVGTLGQLRVIGHALRAWPTPLGVAINSADEVWEPSGELADLTISNQLDLLASQLLTFARSAPTP
jgi:FMN reductase